MTGNVSNFLKKSNLHIPKLYELPSKKNAKKSPNRPIIVKMLKIKDKEKILKAAREK